MYSCHFQPLFTDFFNGRKLISSVAKKIVEEILGSGKLG
jgi:hypothetical protein